MSVERPGEAWAFPHDLPESAVATGMVAETLTPFAYQSLMGQSGTATLPELIGDRAVAFGLAATLGMMWSRVALPERNYRRDLAAMPYRTSVFVTATPKLLPPIIKRLNLDAEAGLQEKVASVARKGNLKDFFLVQEIPPGQIYRGAIFGLDPFAVSGQRELIIRIGLHRSGMVRLRPDEQVKTVYLNAATAALFGRELPVARYCLHSLQLTSSFDLSSAAEEVQQWR